MADESTNTNSSLADAILAETADLYEEPVKEEKEVKEVKEVKETKPEPKNTSKDNDIDIDKLFEEPAKKDGSIVPAVQEKSAAVLAIEAKEREKFERKAEREARQNAKRNAKRARLQALIDKCPNEYKPVSVSTYFWLGVLSFLPGIGFPATILLSIFPINKNVKNFERAILIYYCICIILTLIGMIILFFLTPNDRKNEILAAFDKIAHAFK
jgi:hypothetical protein